MVLNLNLNFNVIKFIWRIIFICYFVIILFNFYQDPMMSSYCLGTLYITSTIILFNSLLPKFIDDRFHISKITIWVEHVAQSLFMAGLIIFSTSARHHLFYPMIFIFSIYGWLSTLMFLIIYIMNLLDILNMMELFSPRLFIDMFNTSLCL